MSNPEADNALQTFADRWERLLPRLKAAIDSRNRRELDAVIPLYRAAVDGLEPVPLSDPRLQDITRTLESLSRKFAAARDAAFQPTTGDFLTDWWGGVRRDVLGITQWVRRVGVNLGKGIENVSAVAGFSLPILAVALVVAFILFFFVRARSGARPI